MDLVMRDFYNRAMLDSIFGHSDKIIVYHYSD